VRLASRALKTAQQTVDELEAKTTAVKALPAPDPTVIEALRGRQGELVMVLILKSPLTLSPAQVAEIEPTDSPAPPNGLSQKPREHA
jgi:hypothetical protein